MTSASPWDFDRYDRTRPSAEAPSGSGSGAGGPTPPSSRFDFDDPVAPGGGALEVGRPPVVWLAAAAGAAVLALLLGGLLIALLGTGVGFAWAGWVIAGPIAIGLLALFTVRDTQAQTRAVYARPGWVAPAYWGALALCVAAVVVNALRLADWFGRL